MAARTIDSLVMRRWLARSSMTVGVRRYILPMVRYTTSELATYVMRSPYACHARWYHTQIMPAAPKGKLRQPCSALSALTGERALSKENTRDL